MSKENSSKYEALLKIAIENFVDGAKGSIVERKNVKQNSKEYYMNLAELSVFYDIFSTLKMHAEALGIDEKDLGLDKIEPDRDLV